MAFLRTTLFSVCLSGAALPVLAQTTPPAAQPAAADPAQTTTSATTPMPDTGIKKATPATHTHHRTHHRVQAVKATTPGT